MELNPLLLLARESSICADQLCSLLFAWFFLVLLVVLGLFILSWVVLLTKQRFFCYRAKVREHGLECDKLVSVGRKNRPRDSGEQLHLAWTLAEGSDSFVR